LELRLTGNATRWTLTSSFRCEAIERTLEREISNNLQLSNLGQEIQAINGCFNKYVEQAID